MYPGRRPDIIMNAMSGQTQDPNALMNSILSIQNFQRQQQQYQQIQGAAPGLAKQLYGDNPTPEQMQMAQGLIASGKFGDIETNLVGGADLDQRQYQAAVRNGTFQGTYTDWRNQAPRPASSSPTTRPRKATRFLRSQIWTSNMKRPSRMRSTLPTIRMRRSKQ